MTDGRTDGLTDGRTDRQTDIPSDRDARTHLKTTTSTSENASYAVYPAFLFRTCDYICNDCDCLVILDGMLKITKNAFISRSDFMAFVRPGLLVHGTSGPSLSVPILVLRRKTKCLLDDGILQSSRVPDGHETRSCQNTQGEG